LSGDRTAACITLPFVCNFGHGDRIEEIGGQRDFQGVNDGIVNSFPGEQLFQTSTNQGDFESEFARKLTAVSDNFNAKLSASDNWNAFQPPQ
jgi:hypothetical protein